MSDLVQGAIDDTVLYRQLTRISALLGYKILEKELPGDVTGENSGNIFKAIIIDPNYPIRKRMYTLTHEIMHILLPEEDFICRDFAEIVVYLATYGVLLAWGYDDSHDTKYGIVKHVLKLSENRLLFESFSKRVPSEEMIYNFMRMAVSSLAVAGGMLTEKHLVMDVGQSMQQVIKLMPKELKELWRK